MTQEYNQEIVVRFVKTLRVSPYDNSWTISIFVNEFGESIRASGNNLPTCTYADVKLYGSWSNATEKYPETFKVISSEIIPPTKKGDFVDYIKSLNVGIGKKTAQALIDHFGDAVWQVLDSNPTDFLSVPGMTESNLENLQKAATDNMVERSINQLFAGVIKVTPTMVRSIKSQIGADHLVQQITENPYILADLHGFTFSDVEKLGRKFAINLDDLRRTEAVAKNFLKEQESKGHVCIPKETFIQGVLGKLNKGKDQTKIGRDLLEGQINELCKQKTIHYVSGVDSGMFYSAKNYQEETGIVHECLRLTAHSVGEKSQEKVLASIAEYEKTNSFHLADCQKDAVCAVFSNKLSIITGGPGTGKSTIIKAILYVHDSLDSGEVVLLAPTGRAAKRMEETTGKEAATIHHRIGYGSEVEKKITGSLIIVDEASMIDQHIAYLLLKNITSHARIVFVGDPCQLPSVGCGNFLDDLIRCQKIHTTKLNVVFRQGSNNSLAENAKKMRDGDADLDLRDGKCRIIDAENNKDLFIKACRSYLNAVQYYGIKNVILLNAYRSDGDINVDNFNKFLQRQCNPNFGNDNNVSNHKWTFYIGDRVMVTKNLEIAKNGDIGTITDIFSEIDPLENNLRTYALIEIDSGETVKFQDRMMKDVDLSYCSTVHKSQGGEYKSVVMAVSSQQSNLNVRAMVYTGFTRAKEHVDIITDFQGKNTAFANAVRNNRTTHRYSLLDMRLLAAL